MRSQPFSFYGPLESGNPLLPVHSSLTKHATTLFKFDTRVQIVRPGLFLCSPAMN